MLSSRQWVIPAGACALFVGLTLGPAVLRAPFADEGWFASAADNLLRKGNLGMSVLDENGYPQRPALLRIQARTYWVLPAYLLATGIWFGAIGTGLLQMRLLSVLWGVCALISSYYLVRQLSGRPEVARLAIAFTAVNEVFVLMGSFGRMDMMCLATGLAGQAVYLGLRGRNLDLALFFANALVCVSLLTHPNGIIAFLMLSSMTIAFDRGRATRWRVALALTPYLLGLFLYGGYVLQDLAAFRAQIAANVPGSRFRGFLHPVVSVSSEIGRWATNYGSPGKALIPLTLLGSFALRVLQFPRERGQRLLLLSAALPLGLLTFFNVKIWFYLIYAAVPLSGVLAVWVYAARRKTVCHRVLAVSFAAAYIVVSLAVDVYRFSSLKDGLIEFRQVAEAAQGQVGDGEIIDAPAHFIFSLGFDRVLNDDSLGYYSGRRPRIYIEAKWSAEELETVRRAIPAEQAYREHLLATEYTTLLETSHYRLWRKVPGGRETRAGPGTTARVSDRRPGLFRSA